MDCENHIYAGVRGAKLAEIPDLSPPPPISTRRTPRHQLHPISTRRTPRRPPSRMFRRSRGAKLAECEEIPSDLTPPPSPSPESVDLATSSSPPALPAPAGDSPPDRSDPKLFRRLPDYSYKQAKTNLPRRLPDSFLVFVPATGDAAAERSEAAPASARRAEVVSTPQLSGDSSTPNPL